MTAPGEVGTQVPFPVPVGGALVQVTDGGNSPVGAMLINRGDNAGTIWVQAGPVGGAAVLPLGPGGSMRWTDRQNVPYARLSAAATAPETLVLTNQTSDYSNPATVAAATALELANRGVPNVYTDAGIGTYRLGSGSSTAALIDVSRFSSLTVSAYWPQPAPLPLGALGLIFTSPAVPDFASRTLFCTYDNNVNPGDGGTWQVPVLGPRLRMVNVPNLANADVYASLVGSNRVSPEFRQLGDEMGSHQIGSATPTGGAGYFLNGYNDSGVAPTVGAQTRMNGSVTLQIDTGGASGTLYANWVDSTARNVHNTFVVAANEHAGRAWSHPRVPVFWTYIPNASVAGNVTTVTVLQN